jgi:hypothetical protein
LERSLSWGEGEGSTGRVGSKFLVSTGSGRSILMADIFSCVLDNLLGGHYTLYEYSWKFMVFGDGIGRKSKSVVETRSVWRLEVRVEFLVASKASDIVEVQRFLVMVIRIS